MKTITVRNITIGSGLPKICVPIVGSNLEDIQTQAAHVATMSPDVVEWRADWFRSIVSQEDTDKACRLIRQELPDIPLLFTFRTRAEGGEMDFPTASYVQLIRYAVSHLDIDLVDVEFFLGNDIVKELLDDCHRAGIPVILSNHDFQKTPDFQELLSRLRAMEALGGDIAKIAVMPQSPSDVLTLLAATEVCARTARCPLITMSMSQMGLISRLCGDLTGSALTFGSAGHASAPGQIPVDQLREFLAVLQIHK